MRTRALLAVVALSCAPLLAARNDPAYPTERVAGFLVAKLDLNSLPSAFRPMKQKGKRTFADYGFTAQRVDESEAIVEAQGGAKGLKIKVLDQKSSGIYVCIAERGRNNAETETQSVGLLTRRGPDSLLKARESFRGYAACPVIGGSDSTVDSYGGD